MNKINIISSYHDAGCLVSWGSNCPCCWVFFRKIWSVELYRGE